MFGDSTAISLFAPKWKKILGIFISELVPSFFAVGSNYNYFFVC